MYGPKFGHLFPGTKIFAAQFYVEYFFRRGLHCFGGFCWKVDATEAFGILTPGTVQDANFLARSAHWRVLRCHGDKEFDCFVNGFWVAPGRIPESDEGAPKCFSVDAWVWIDCVVAVHFGTYFGRHCV